MTDSEPVVLFVLPSLRISGGILEALRLAGGIRNRGADARVLVLWKHPNAVDRVEVPGIPALPLVYLSDRPARKARALLDFPLLLSKFRTYVQSVRDSTGTLPSVVTTHYSTLPFGHLVPGQYRYNFLQDEEWLFLPPGIARAMLKAAIIFAIRRSRVITANSYISDRFRSRGVSPVRQASIWADTSFGTATPGCNRPFDLVMVLRYGDIKRLDLYWQLLSELKRDCHLKCAAITCEDGIAGECAGRVDVCLLRPTSAEMKDLFSRSKVFVLLSEREGFGLPPLEAMGTGCVPVCRDSGGVHCYMKDNLVDNLFPLDAPMATLAKRILGLVSDSDLLQALADEATRIFHEGERQAREERERAWDLFTSGRPALHQNQAK